MPGLQSLDPVALAANIQAFNSFRSGLHPPNPSGFGPPIQSPLRFQMPQAPLMSAQIPSFSNPPPGYGGEPIHSGVRQESRQAPYQASFDQANFDQANFDGDQQRREATASQSHDSDAFDPRRAAQLDASGFDASARTVPPPSSDAANGAHLRSRESSERAAQPRDPPPRSLDADSREPPPRALLTSLHPTTQRESEMRGPRDSGRPTSTRPELSDPNLTSQKYGSELDDASNRSMPRREVTDPGDAAPGQRASSSSQSAPGDEKTDVTARIEGVFTAVPATVIGLNCIKVIRANCMCMCVLFTFASVIVPCSHPIVFSSQFSFQVFFSVSLDTRVYGHGFLHNIRPSGAS